MSRVAGARGRDTVAYRAPLSHARDFDLSEQTTFARAVRRLGRPDLIALFGHRANRTTIANWIAGRHPAPQWAIDRLNQEWHAIDTEMRRELASLKPGPGKRVGAINLARYRAQNG